MGDLSETRTLGYNKSLLESTSTNGAILIRNTTTQSAIQRGTPSIPK